MSTAAVAFEKMVAVLQIAIVARLLAPADFGIIALGLAFLLGLTGLTTLGVEKHLIQRPQLPSDFVRAAWLVNIVRCAIVSTIAFGSATFYAQWVGNAAVEPVLRFIALAPLLLSFSSPNQYVAQRELRFQIIATFQISTSIIQLMVFVTLAYMLRNAYALAAGQVAMSAIKAILSWAWFGLPGWPLLQSGYLREILNVGRHFLVIAVGTFVMTQADNLIVGSLLGAAALGFYTLAYKASQFSVDLMNATLGRVVLPVFARLQHEPRRLLSAFTEIWRLQIALLLPFGAAIAVLANELVLLLFGPRYTESATLLRLLALLTLGRGISHLLAPFIIGTGGVSFASKIKALEACLFLLCVWLGTKAWGASGAALGAGVVYLFSAAARLVYVMMTLSLGPRWLLSSAGGAVICSTIASLATIGFFAHIATNPSIKLSIAATGFLASYAVSSFFLQRDLFVLVRRNLASLRQKAT